MECDAKGYARLNGLIHGNLEEWRELARPVFESGKPGLRISNLPELAQGVAQLIATPRLTNTIGTGWRCVRAIAFNKTEAANWALGWHQDRTIAVRAKATVEGFGPWSAKDGIVHVEPPVTLLERMMTLRLHLDDVDNRNGALLVASGSHLHGRISATEIGGVLKQSDIERCDAKAGDGWIYATPILHASGRSASSAPRRVLHLDLSRDQLPTPLDWHELG